MQFSWNMSVCVIVNAEYCHDFPGISASMQRKENSSNWTSTPLRRNNNNSSKCKINISGKVLSFQRVCSLNFKLLVIWHRGFKGACGYSSLLCVALGTNSPSRKESVYSPLDLESDPSDGVVLNPENIPALNRQCTTGCSCYCDQVLPLLSNCMGGKVREIVSITICLTWVH